MKNIFHLFFIIFTFAPLSSYARIDYQKQIARNIYTASLRNKYNDQNQEDLKIEACLKDKKNQAYHDAMHKSFAGNYKGQITIVYDNFFEVWGPTCERIGRYYFGKSYIYVYQGNSSNKLTKCLEGHNLPREINWFWEKNNGLVRYSQDLNIDLSQSRFQVKKWFEPHEVTYVTNVFPREDYVRYCL